jgi:hypothetical protein
MPLCNYFLDGLIMHNSNQKKNLKVDFTKLPCMYVVFKKQISKSHELKGFYFARKLEYRIMEAFGLPSCQNYKLPPTLINY